MRKGIFAMLKAGSPMLLGALVVGLVVSLFQAMTQIQEQTISFIPKILTVFGLLILMLPFMFSILSEFTMELFDLMTKLH